MQLNVEVATAPFLAANLDGNAAADLVIDFGPAFGLWARLNNTTWKQLNAEPTEAFAAADLDENGIDDLVVDFGAAWGVWIYRNGTTWDLLNVESPTGPIVTGDLDGL